MKRKLIETLEAIESAGSIYDARCQADTHKDTFNDRLERLRALNINPVIIPNNWGNDYLPSLRSQIERWPEGRHE
jgi:hypothetical protein